MNRQDGDYREQMNKFRKTGKMCDFIVKSREGIEYPAHKCVLAAASPHFDAMFDSGMKEAQEGVAIMAIDSPVLRFIMDYMYTSELPVGMYEVFPNNPSKQRSREKWAKRLTPEAAYLQINSLKEAGINFLLSSLCSVNCLDLWEWATAHSFDRLADAAWTHAAVQFDHISPESFVLLPFDDFKRLITNTDLFCREVTIFHAIVNWVQYCEEDRRQYLFSLFRLLRLSSLNSACLIDTVGRHPLIESDPQCLQLYRHALESLVRRGPNLSRDRCPNASGRFVHLKRVGTDDPPILRFTKSRNTQ